MIYVAVMVDKSLSIIRHVVGLDVNAYSWSVRAYGKDLPSLTSCCCLLLYNQFNLIC